MKIPQIIAGRFLKIVDQIILSSYIKSMVILFLMTKAGRIMWFKFEVQPLIQNGVITTILV